MLLQFGIVGGMFSISLNILIVFLYFMHNLATFKAFLAKRGESHLSFKKKYRRRFVHRHSRKVPTREI